MNYRYQCLLNLAYLYQHTPVRLFHRYYDVQYNIHPYNHDYGYHSFKNELTKLLTNEKGAIRNWADFKKEADKLSDTYNQRWLKTEYDHAVAASNMASKWNDFQKRKHLYPNLKYNAINDSRVRELHKKWDGLVLPINHPFWDTHYPPNDWSCRCDVTQVDDDINEKGIEVEDMPNLPKQFNLNYGKQGRAFDKNHPCFKTHIEDKRALQEDVERYKLKNPRVHLFKGQKCICKCMGRQKRLAC